MSKADDDDDDGDDGRLTFRRFFSFLEGPQVRLTGPKARRPDAADASGHGACLPALKRTRETLVAFEFRSVSTGPKVIQRDHRSARAVKVRRPALK